MANTTNTLDLGSLLGTDVSKTITDQVINSLLLSMEEFQSSTTVSGTGNIFKCAISLGDFNFNLSMDMFKFTPTKMDYILLKKIQYLRRLITNINNIFIHLIQDLDCCTGDDRYNKTVVPIFKWLVEDKNGLCGSLLTIAKNINTIYLPLKRIMCLFKVIPGNPTLPISIDPYATIYPIVDGLEKMMNMLDNGRFLDLLIIPVKDFHDKLVACSNNKDADFYTGYTSLKDIISDSVYNELTANFIDSLKAVQNETTSELTSEPQAPTPPVDSYSVAVPNRANFSTYEEYSKALYEWNVGYSSYRKSTERQYDQEYSDYLKKLNDYRQTKFEKTLQINQDTFTNSTMTAEILVDDFKTKHRSICGCLGEIFRLDGLFIPKEYIIRTEDDLQKLVGEVKYKGISISNYYTDQDQTKIAIINAGTLNTLRLDAKDSTFTETLKYPFVRDDLLERINNTTSINDVINLNIQFNKELEILQTKYRKASNYYDAVNSAYYSLYLKEINDARVIMNKYKLGQISSEKYENARRIVYEYSEYPPGPWISSNKWLPSEQQAIYGNISYLDMVSGTEELTTLQTQMNELKQAIGRNYSSIKIVDNASIECGCDLLCMIVKYIINLIMQVIKLLLSYITSYLANAIANKELMWWIKFIQSKIQCIVDIANLSKDIKEMEAKFKQELDNAAGMIQKVPESLTSCSSSKSSVIDELNLYPLKAHVLPDGIKDITWVPRTYPDFGYDNSNDYPNDITPYIDNTFNIDTNGESKNTDWANRTIPTIILDCTKDHHTVVDWVPSTSSWKMFLNIKLNIDQFNNSQNIVINGNAASTDAEIMADIDLGIVYKLMSIPVGQENFNFKFDYNLDVLTFEDNESLTSTITSEYFNCKGRTYSLSAINVIWFAIDNEYFKVYDKFTQPNLTDYITTSKAKLTDAIKNLQVKELDTTIPETTNNKICSASSLSVTLFEQVFNDKSMSEYPGDITKLTNPTSGEVTYSFTPKTYKITKNNPDGTTYEEDAYFTKNNVPFKLELTNGSGTKFTVVALIDICIPTNVIKTPYSKDVDGVFLNGRYDYIEFASIPNTGAFNITSTEIISKLKTYLQNIGAISDSLVGPASNSTFTDSTLVKDLISNTVEDNTYSDGFDTNQDTSKAKDTINNLSNAIKKDITMFTALYDAYSTSIDNLDEISSNLSTEYSSGNNPNIPSSSDLLTKSDSILGIPLAVLNEEKNIILTIQDKRLKLLNINNNFSINIPLSTGEIDYQAGEQLFIEFSTTGFNHTISWTNERKVTDSATVMATNSITLKPTQLGSYYKDGVKVALMCGVLLDIIFTESPQSKDDWMNNSNTFRPSGTIGYYDFSVFDGYNVYSIPEAFKVTQLGSLATVKGILYESKEYTREEILIKIQNGEINSLLSNEVVVVGEKPITVLGDFIWKNNVYYKNVTFGYLDNFFCRDNLSESSFTISFWLKIKDSVTNGKEDFKKKYIFADINNGNFIWLEDEELKIQLFGQPLRIEPVKLLFKKDMSVDNPVYVEKWFHHVFKYDKANATVYYTINAIDRKRNFDINYDSLILEPKEVKIPLINSSIGKKIKFSLVTMLARYDVKSLKYTDFVDAEIAAIAIWKEYKDESFINTIYDYQKRIIINEMD